MKRIQASAKIWSDIMDKSKSVLIEKEIEQDVIISALKEDIIKINSMIDRLTDLVNRLELRNEVILTKMVEMKDV